VDPLRRLVEALLRWDLRGAFRMVHWVGAWPPALPDGPVIAYANHHHYFDGHLAWLLFQQRLGRPATLWMAEWDRFPFFGAVGAQPFPPDDASRRAATLRRTGRRFREAPSTVLVYFPSAELRPPEAGLPALETPALDRLDALYPNAQWWPFALHVTWRGHARPTAFVTGGPAHSLDGREQDRLATAWDTLRSPAPSPLHPLLEGRRSAADLWTFSFAAPLFSRYLS